MRFDDGLLQLGRPLPPLDPSALPGAGRPDWVQADPRFIERALARANARSGGGWVVVDASANVTAAPRRVRRAGRDWVVWRTDAGPHLAPDACPHMGAPLHDAKVEDRCLVCPWHGLRLGPAGRGDWRPAPTFDDGWLVWARLLDDEAPTDAPTLPRRPEGAIGGVIGMEARCEAEDVIANRLDPWHGAHFHPHSFARLELLEVDEDVLRLRVSYRVVGRVCVEVDATFHAPTRRSIVMTIVDGDGVGSVVETHASPVDSAGPRTAVVEATLATSDRRGFGLVRQLAPLARPLIEARARKLWIEDCAYAERRYALRVGRSPT
ncbi:MAG: Rieske 2Fe-2S domain-containing protein [Myxococcales bacterium]|nr:Rieske 2Fe-2S domain-containing protein [Myxococcales bacterium]